MKSFKMKSLLSEVSFKKIAEDVWFVNSAPHSTMTPKQYTDKEVEDLKNELEQEGFESEIVEQDTNS